MIIKILMNTNPYYTASAGSNRWLTLIEGLQALGANIHIMVLGSFQSAEEQRLSKIEMKNGVRINYFTNKLIVGIWQGRYEAYIGKQLNMPKVKKRVYQELKDFEGIVWAENDLAFWKIINQIKSRKFKLIAEMSEFLDIHNYNKGNVLQRISGGVKKNILKKIILIYLMVLY